jgi:hypothetical protein
VSVGNIIIYTYTISPTGIYFRMIETQEILSKEGYANYKLFTPVRTKVRSTFYIENTRQTI